MISLSEEVIRTNEFLRNGATILSPTDTVWGIGCDATNPTAIEKVFNIKERSLDRSMLILLDQPEKISLYVEHIPAIAWDLMEQVNRPTTFIYPKAKNLPPSLIAADGSIAIRIVKHEFCQKLIGLFGKPVVSTSANLSGKATPIHFKDIDETIKKRVDYIVKEEFAGIGDLKPSTIIRFVDDYNFEIVRE